MGRRGSTETVAAVLLAFLDSNVWSQSALARHIDVERKTLVRILTDLSQGGMPLSREEDHPQVYWSVPKGWFPGAIAFPSQELEHQSVRNPHKIADPLAAAGGLVAVLLEVALLLLRCSLLGCQRRAVRVSSKRIRLQIAVRARAGLVQLARARPHPSCCRRRKKSPGMT